MADHVKHRTGDRNLERIQDLAKENAERDLPPMIRDGRDFDVVFDGGSVVSVKHGLRRQPKGWFLHSTKGSPYTVVETLRNEQELRLINQYAGASELNAKVWVW